MAAPQLDPERLRGLYAAKLRALVDGHSTGGERPLGSVEPRAFAGGAALITDVGVAWLLIEQAEAGLGAALAWTHHQGATSLMAIVDGAAAPRATVLARQALAFASPPPVWAVRGRTLVPAEPEPFAPALPVPEAALARAQELAAAGLEVVIENGAVHGEIRGLEVAVVTIDEDGTARIEVGVGRHDREAFAMLHGSLAAHDAMCSVVDTVSAQRREGAPPHPLNRLAPEQWLRWHLIDDPTRLGGWHLEPLYGVASRGSVQDRGPAFAHGHDETGRPLVLACSVGIDLELVPTAADVRARVQPDARLVLALPARDAHGATQRLAASLAEPAEILPIEGVWQR